MYQKSLKRNHCQKISGEKPVPKISERISTKQTLKRYLFKKSEEKKYPKKSLKRNHYQKISETILYERISKETFPAKRLEEESLPKNVRRHFKQNLLDDDMYLTKNSLKRNPSKKILDETCLPQFL